MYFINLMLREPILLIRCCHGHENGNPFCLFDTINVVIFQHHYTLKLYLFFKEQFLRFCKGLTKMSLPETQAIKQLFLKVNKKLEVCKRSLMAIYPSLLRQEHAFE
jgi:hypothetical protein